MRFLLVSLLVLIQSTVGYGLNITGGIQWAVLVAGSNGFENYRHQSDICHAYQVLRYQGIPENRIITMMYNDIAKNPKNPYPGQIFFNYDHINVYQGVRIDYKGDMINAGNFLKVLLGDAGLKKQGYKVLESNKDDNVFVFFSGHGSEKVMAFPDTTLPANILAQALERMNSQKKFKKMLFYLETCFSGSIFDGYLKPSINVFAATSANPKESSWGVYCDDQKIRTCLANEYTTLWLNDCKEHDLGKWTLQQQYESIKGKMKKSHPMEYGDMKMQSMKVSEFLGRMNNLQFPSQTDLQTEDRVDNRDAHLHYLIRQLKETDDALDVKVIQDKLSRALQLAQMVNRTFQLIAERIETGVESLFNTSVSRLDADKCYESAYNTYASGCFTMQKVPEVAEHMGVLLDFCESGYDPEKFLKVIEDVCH